MAKFSSLSEQLRNIAVWLRAFERGVQPYATSVDEAATALDAQAAEIARLTENGDKLFSVAFHHQERADKAEHELGSMRALLVEAERALEQVLWWYGSDHSIPAVYGVKTPRSKFKCGPITAGVFNIARTTITKLRAATGQQEKP